MYGIYKKSFTEYLEYHMKNINLNLEKKSTITSCWNAQISKIYLLLGLSLWEVEIQWVIGEAQSDQGDSRRFRKYVQNKVDGVSEEIVGSLN